MFRLSQVNNLEQQDYRQLKTQSKLTPCSSSAQSELGISARYLMLLNLWSGQVCGMNHDE